MLKMVTVKLGIYGAPSAQGCSMLFLSRGFTPFNCWATFTRGDAPGCGIPGFQPFRNKGKLASKCYSIEQPWPSARQLVWRPSPGNRFTIFRAAISQAYSLNLPSLTVTCQDFFFKWNFTDNQFLERKFF